VENIIVLDAIRRLHSPTYPQAQGEGVPAKSSNAATNTPEKKPPRPVSPEDVANIRIRFA